MDFNNKILNLIERKDLIDDIVPPFSDGYIRNKDTLEYDDLMKKEKDHMRRLAELENDTVNDFDDVKFLIKGSRTINFRWKRKSFRLSRSKINK